VKNHAIWLVLQEKAENSEGKHLPPLAADIISGCNQKHFMFSNYVTNTRPYAENIHIQKIIWKS
jgi:hypothetical protein